MIDKNYRSFKPVILITLILLSIIFNDFATIITYLCLYSLYFKSNYQGTPIS